MELQWGDENGYGLAVFSVRDTGAGIPPEEQTRLFERFSRSQGAVVRRSEGAGLGLHLSQRLAELMGGRITFKTEVGKGSKFTLSLPKSK